MLPQAQPRSVTVNRLYRKVLITICYLKIFTWEAMKGRKWGTKNYLSMKSAYQNTPWRIGYEVFLSHFLPFCNFPSSCNKFQLFCCKCANAVYNDALTCYFLIRTFATFCNNVSKQFVTNLITLSSN